MTMRTPMTNDESDLMIRNGNFVWGNATESLSRWIDARLQTTYSESFENSEFGIDIQNSDDAFFVIQAESIINSTPGVEYHTNEGVEHIREKRGLKNAVVFTVSNLEELDVL